MGTCWELRYAKGRRYASLYVQGPQRCANLRQDVTSLLPDNQTARKEAVAIFADLARSFCDDIETNPEWRIEVTDELGAPIFRVTILAESLA
jgi:hypothetical protein